MHCSGGSPYEKKRTTRVCIKLLVFSYQDTTTRVCKWSVRLFHHHLRNAPRAAALVIS